MGRADPRSRSGSCLRPGCDRGCGPAPPREERQPHPEGFGPSRPRVGRGWTEEGVLVDAKGAYEYFDHSDACDSRHVSLVQKRNAEVLFFDGGDDSL